MTRTRVLGPGLALALVLLSASALAQVDTPTNTAVPTSTATTTATGTAGPPTLTPDITRTPEEITLDTLDCLWPGVDVSLGQLPTEGSDLTVRLRVRSIGGALLRPAQVNYAVHDQATGTELLATTSLSPTSTLVKFILSSAVQTIVRSGFCAVATGTACASSVDCPAGQSCLQVPDETHLLTVELLLPGGGRRTLEYPFRVRNLAHWPLT